MRFGNYLHWLRLAVKELGSGSTDSGYLTYTFPKNENVPITPFAAFRHFLPSEMTTSTA
jgi:hypothetical protein